MFGIGFTELIVIFIVALLVLGPKRLPEVAKTLGKFYREIKSTVDEVKEVVIEEPKPHTPPVEEKLSKIDDLEDELDKEIKKEKKNHHAEPKREKISFKKGEKVNESEPEKS
ncbi:sec-independent protein translocase protein TatB [Persephonella hydrogeniphila]|uniref:Sec-independent protein translocase protein TatB n=1 Tax=Persephonella hydrogeniphila TaxID=198703 RepID=A0A285NBS4_9AQUI|nr:Sec-independent protein translocase protein TatB [Persephonella hydrogeniphila]SNZ06738.1 sec-independent protein translocase protein TatB [Persephonella hydrogeniphila]